jgi:hypothetical protein
MGTSREWVRVLEARGLKQIANGNRMDLTGLPTYTKQQRRRAVAVAYSLPPETMAMLKTLNDDAQRWRVGKDDSNVKAFNRIVQTLLDAGVPMNAIARGVDQPSRSFRRRMNRWGVIGPNNPPSDWKTSDSKPVRKSLTTVRCNEPDCPIPGAHVHD